MEKHQRASAGTAIIAKSAESADGQLRAEAAVTTATSAAGTVITVTPTVEITDPFLATRVVPPHIGTGPRESSAEPAETAATAAERPPAESSAEPAETAITAKSAENTSVESSTVKPQKKTVAATVGATTASGTPLQVQLPPISINFPPMQQSPAAPADGRRDQPQPEAKPSIMMPLGSITRQIEVTTRGMEIQVGSTLLMYYDWLRGRGYERSLSEFINQTVEAYFAEKGLMLGITFRRD